MAEDQVEVLLKNEFYFDRIVLGGSLESLMFSYVNEIPLLMTQPIVPFEMDVFPYNPDLKFLGYDNTRPIYTSEIWDRLSFVLSMAGLLMMPNIIQKIRQEDKCIVIITDNNKRIRITYDEAIAFDKELEDNVHVYDWFDVRSGSAHEYKQLID